MKLAFMTGLLIGILIGMLFPNMAGLSRHEYEDRIELAGVIVAHHLATLKEDLPSSFTDIFEAAFRAGYSLAIADAYNLTVDMRHRGRIREVFEALRSDSEEFFEKDAGRKFRKELTP